MRDFPRRFGGFLVMVGSVSLVFFFLSDSLGQAEGWYLLIGTLLVGIGATILWRRREKPQESNRFRALRRMSSRDKGSDKMKKRSKKKRGRGGQG